MQRQKRWKVAAAVFAITVAVLLLGGGLVANAKEDKDNDDHGREKNDLFVYANTVLGGPPPLGCVETNRLPLGQKLVWRIRVLDKARKPLDNTNLESVVVRLLDNQGEIIDEIPARFGTHPPGPTPVDAFWTATWVTDSTGSFDYEVVATGHGHHPKMGTFQDFGTSLLTITGP